MFLSQNQRRSAILAIDFEPEAFSASSYRYRHSQYGRLIHGRLMVDLTSGIDTQKVLENACRVGAFVASRSGATPLLSPEIIQQFKERLACGA